MHLGTLRSGRVRLAKLQPEVGSAVKRLGRVICGRGALWEEIYGADGLVGGGNSRRRGGVCWLQNTGGSMMMMMMMEGVFSADLGRDLLEMVEVVID